MVLAKLAAKCDDVVPLDSRLVESCSGVGFLPGEYFVPNEANVGENTSDHFFCVAEVFFVLFLHILFLGALNDVFDSSVTYCLLDSIYPRFCLDCFLGVEGFEHG